MRVKVVLAGGQGKRLFPLSTEDTPKQYVVFDETTPTLLSQTLDCSIDEDITLLLVSSNTPASITNSSNSKIITLAEPCRRDTSAAICLATVYIHRRWGPDTEIVVLPADNIIETSGLLASVTTASAALQTHLITFGIDPQGQPETVYGYIQAHNTALAPGVATVKSFSEKPDRATAERYVAAGYLWNAGIYYGTAGTFRQLYADNSRDTLQHCQDFLDGDVEAFSRCRSISFDYDISEKSSNLAVCTYTGLWVDIGNWASLYQWLRQRQGKELITSGSVNTLNVADSIVMNRTNIPVYVIGLSNVVVTLTEQGLIVSPLDRAVHIKNMLP